MMLPVAGKQTRTAGWISPTASLLPDRWARVDKLRTRVRKAKVHIRWQLTVQTGSVRGKVQRHKLETRHYGTRQYGVLALISLMSTRLVGEGESGDSGKISSVKQEGGGSDLTQVSVLCMKCKVCTVYRVNCDCSGFLTL